MDKELKWKFSNTVDGRKSMVKSLQEKGLGLSELDKCQQDLREQTGIDDFKQLNLTKI